MTWTCELVPSMHHYGWQMEWALEKVSTGISTAIYHTHVHAQTVDLKAVVLTSRILDRYSRLRDTCIESTKHFKHKEP